MADAIDQPNEHGGAKVFGNYLILKSIFKNLWPRQYLRLRMLNKAANEAATDVLLEDPSVRPVQFRRAEDVDVFVSTMTKRLEHTKVIYSAFDLHIMSITADKVQEFAEAIGPSVTSYRIEGFLGQEEEKHNIITLLSNAPNLRTLELGVDYNLTLTEVQRKLLPDFSELREISNNHYVDKVEPQATTLFKSISQMSPHLRLVSLSNCSGDVLRDLPSILFVADRTPPALDLDMPRLEGQHASGLEELVQLGYDRVRKFKFIVSKCSDEAEWNKLIRSLNKFTALQVDSLEHLNFCIWSFGVVGPNVKILLPTMNKLRTLGIQRVEHLPKSLSSAVCPFTSEQFPALEIFDGAAYFLNDSVHFQTLTTLRVIKQLELAVALQLHLFPNLKNLLLLETPSPFAFMTYALTQLTHLERLDLHWDDPEVEAKEFWNLYTGGASERSKEDLLKLFQEKVPEFELGVELDGNGDLKTPSFANMRRLEILRIPIGTRLELNALVYMSVARKLRRLILMHLDTSMQVDKKTKSILKSFHKNLIVGANNDRNPWSC